MYRVAAAVEAALTQRRGHPLLDEANGLGEARAGEARPSEEGGR
jgi:hypothetical protein